MNDNTFFAIVVICVSIIFALPIIEKIIVEYHKVSICEVKK